MERLKEVAWWVAMGFAIVGLIVGLIAIVYFVNFVLPQYGGYSR